MIKVNFNLNVLFLVILIIHKVFCCMKQEEPKPEMTPTNSPPGAPCNNIESMQADCRNGGQCYLKESIDGTQRPICFCPDGYEGVKCERKTIIIEHLKGNTLNAGAISGIVIALVGAVILVVVIGFLFYRQYSKRDKPSLNSQLSYQESNNKSRDNFNIGQNFRETGSSRTRTALPPPTSPGQKNHGFVSNGHTNIYSISKSNRSQGGDEGDRNISPRPQSYSPQPSSALTNSSTGPLAHYESTV